MTCPAATELEVENRHDGCCTEGSVDRQKVEPAVILDAEAGLMTRNPLLAVMVGRHSRPASARIAYCLMDVIVDHKRGKYGLWVLGTIVQRNVR